VIQFVGDLRHVGGFLRVLWSHPPKKKTDCHDIAEILFKVAINTINLNQTRKSLNVVLQDGLCLILNDKRRFVPSKWP
jgi:hypothetical protein